MLNIAVLVFAVGAVGGLILALGMGDGNRSVRSQRAIETVEEVP